MRRAAIAAAAIALLAPPSDAYPRPGATERVSVSSSGRQANAQSGYGVWSTPVLAMTPDARYVAFTSDASNLVAGDTNRQRDVFVRDRRTGRTERVSVASGGAQGTTKLLVSGLQGCDGAGAPAISADGRYVAFRACFDNLVPLDVNLADDVFVHDRRTRETTLVSVGPEGRLFLTASSYPVVSGDGRRVVFRNADQQLYLRDLAARTTTLVSAGTAGEPGNGGSGTPSISGDGRYVTFLSGATNLVPNTLAHCVLPCLELYLLDLRTRTTTLVSKDGSGEGKGANGSDCCMARAGNLSANNRYLVFESNAAFVPNPGNTRTPLDAGGHVYVLDRSTGRVERVSVDSTGGGLISNYGATISADGRFVAFVTGDGSSGCQRNAVVVHDRKTGATDTIGPDCQPDAEYGRAPALSRDGRYVAFFSDAARHVTGDTNHAGDIFVRDRGTELGTGRIGSAVDPRADVAATLAAGGADLTGASLVDRPRLGDLFVRIQVAHMPPFALASPAVGYGVELTAGGVRYQVRAAKTGLGASFGLFRRGALGWIRVADLDGGYGATGEEVVVSVPLPRLDVGSGTEIHAVTAFTTYGGLPVDRVSVRFG